VVKPGAIEHKGSEHGCNPAGAWMSEIDIQGGASDRGRTGSAVGRL
jgi:hypothetical protein